MTDPEGDESGPPAAPVVFTAGGSTERPDHEFEVLEDDQTVPPRPEELIADAERHP